MLKVINSSYWSFLKLSTRTALGISKRTLKSKTNLEFVMLLIVLAISVWVLYSIIHGLGFTLWLSCLAIGLISAFYIGIAGAVITELVSGRK